MTSIFSNTKDKRKYRHTFTRLIAILELLNDKTLSRWRLSCMLQTNPSSLDSILDTMVKYNLISLSSERFYALTPKGRNLLEVLRQ